VNAWQNVAARLRRLFGTLGEAHRAQAVNTAEAELRELQHVFALLVMGQAVGLPSPPAQITLALLPEMEDELRLLLDRIDTAQAPFSELYSTFPVD